MGQAQGRGPGRGAGRVQGKSLQVGGDMQVLLSSIGSLGDVQPRVQVIIPHNYDQFYWAHRVGQLGVGVSGPARDDLTVDALVQALRECLRPEVTMRAQALAGRMELHGARIAAERLTNEFG